MLRGHNRRDISSIKFSPDGIYLVMCRQDMYHTMVIYDWENEMAKAYFRTGYWEEEKRLNIKKHISYQKVIEGEETKGGRSGGAT